VSPSIQAIIGLMEVVRDDPETKDKEVKSVQVRDLPKGERRVSVHFDDGLIHYVYAYITAEGRIEYDA